MAGSWPVLRKAHLVRDRRRMAGDARRSTTRVGTPGLSVTDGRDWDGLVAHALRVAAKSVAPEVGDKSFLEKRLAAAVGEALEGEVAPARVLLNKKLANVKLPNWDPQPGWFDLALVGEDDRLLVAAELKLDDIEHTLWDIFKVGAARRLADVQAGYVIAAAPLATWESGREVVELFSDKGEEAWESRFFFDEYRKAWSDLLRGGKGRPTSVARTFSIQPLVKVRVEHYPPYELRAVRIDTTQDRLTLEDGWPGLTRGEIADEHLTLDDIPPDRAEEEAFHVFAITTNGYERMGSFARCAGLANSARETWRLNREVPASLRDLRCCLFFEQRRFHHYGDGFDEKTLEYVRELLGAMRVHVEAAKR